MTPDSGQRHHSYLLRIWQVGNGNAPEWRFFVEDVQTREHRAFANLTGLMAFLAAQIDTATAGQAPAPGADGRQPEAD